MPGSALLAMLLTFTPVSLQDPIACDPGGFVDEESFVRCARIGTERFHDRDSAILEGYRRIGGDFPAMGEHWINIGLVFDNELDPRRPEVLSYAVIDDEPVLLGVAYALPLLKGEAPPEVPVGRDAWHDHSKTIGAETFLPGHETAETSGSARIAMLHAWIWAPNPVGMFVPDNWAIPYVRLGLEPSDSVAAARALSLASGAQAYFKGMVDEVADLSGMESMGVRGAFDSALSAVTDVLGARDGSRLGEGEARRLGEIWERMWRDIRALADDETRVELDRILPGLLEE